MVTKSSFEQLIPFVFIFLLIEFYKIIVKENSEAKQFKINSFQWLNIIIAIITTNNFIKPLSIYPILDIICSIYQGIVLIYFLSVYYKFIKNNK